MSKHFLELKTQALSRDWDWMLLVDQNDTAMTRDLVQQFQFEIESDHDHDFIIVRNGLRNLPGLVAIRRRILHHNYEWPGNGIHGLDTSAWIEYAFLKRKKVKYIQSNVKFEVPRNFVCFHKFVVCVSTYVPTRIRQNTFERSLASLMKSKNGNTHVILVDDGSPLKDHLQWTRLKFPTIEIIERPVNGGLSKCKNTGLKRLLELSEKESFVCALADDDLEYFPGFEDLYVSALSIRECETYGPRKILCATTSSKDSRNFFQVLPQTLCNGQFICFHSQDLHNVGYFKIFPKKQGHEHVWWTLRFMITMNQRFFFDVTSSCHFVKHGLGPPSLGQTEMMQGIRSNVIVFDNERFSCEFQKQDLVE